MMSDPLYLPGKLLVGLSGGADSVALLHMFHQGGSQISAVHVNHGLRGDASDGDEAFVRRLCAEMDIRLYVYRAVPPENPGEGWARQARYGFFRQAMAESGADALVLAHHRDDQAETLLLHLLRGAGLNGLAGMAADTTVDGLRILRPLLGFSRAELRAYLTQMNQPWREDASNADVKYLRNAVRLNLLPLMERLAPGAAGRMAQTASLLREDEIALHALTADFLRQHAAGRVLPLDALQTQPTGLQRRILRDWWTACVRPEKERSLSAVQSEELLSLVHAPTGARCSLPGGWHGYRGWTHLHLCPPEEARFIPETAVADSPLLTLEAFTGETGDGQTCQAIPRAWLAECTVRGRRKGDFIRPFGMMGRQSIQDYLTNRHVDAPFRCGVPLLCRGSEVLLVGGVGCGGIPRTEEMKDPVLIRWTERFPWRTVRNEEAKIHDRS